MVAFTYAPKTFDGVSLTASPFNKVGWRVDNSPLGTRSYQAVEADVAGRGPRDVRGQPQGSTWELYCRLVADTEAVLAAFLAVFSEERGLSYLEADDAAAVRHRVACRVLSAHQIVDGLQTWWRVVLRVPDPVWQTSALVTSPQSNLAVAVTNFAVTNAGNRIARPTVTVRGEKKLNLAFDFMIAHRQFVVNRSPFFWNNLPVNLLTFSSSALLAVAGVTRQINLVGGISAVATTIPYDTSAGTWPAAGMFKVESEQIYYAAYSGTEFTGCVRGVGGTTAATHADNLVCTRSDILNDGEDIRVFVNDEEVDSWIGGFNGATTRVWANLSMPPRVKLTLSRAMTASAPADGGEVAFDEGVADLPESGAVMVTGEVISYTGRDVARGVITGINRATWYTSAAIHAVGTTWYFVSLMPVVVAMGRRGGEGSSGTFPTGSVDPGPAPRPLSRRPCIDLVASTNAQWRWGNTASDPLTVFYDSANPDRTAAWQPSYEVPASDQNDAEALRLESSGASVVWRDSDPASGKPLVPRLVQTLPQGVEAVASAITYDVQMRRSILMRILGRDANGLEVELANRHDIAEALATGQTITPTATLHQLILNGVRAATTGNIDTGGSFGIAALNHEIITKMVLQRATRIASFGMSLKKDAAGDDFAFKLFLYDNSGSNPQQGRTVWDQPLGTGVALSASLTTAFAWYNFPTKTNSYIVLQPGTYWLALRMTLRNSGTLSWENGAIRTKHDAAGTFAPTWVYSNDGDVARFMLIHDRGGPIDDDAVLINQGIQADFDNLIVELNDAAADPYAPDVGTLQADTYHGIGRIENTTNGKYIDVDFFAQLPSQTDPGVLTINCEDKTAVYDQGAWTRPCASAIRPSDPADWLPLEPGTNDLRYTEYGNTDCDLTVTFRSAKV